MKANDNELGAALTALTNRRRIRSANVMASGRRISSEKREWARDHYARWRHSYGHRMRILSRGNGTEA